MLVIRSVCGVDITTKYQNFIDFVKSWDVTFWLKFCMDISFMNEKSSFYQVRAFVFCVLVMQLNYLLISTVDSKRKLFGICRVCVVKHSAPSSRWAAWNFHVLLMHSCMKYDFEEYQCRSCSGHCAGGRGRYLRPTWRVNFLIVLWYLLFEIVNYLVVVRNEKFFVKDFIDRNMPTKVSKKVVGMIIRSRKTIMKDGVMTVRKINSPIT